MNYIKKGGVFVDKDFLRARDIEKSYSISYSKSKELLREFAREVKRSDSKIEKENLIEIGKIKWANRKAFCYFMLYYEDLMDEVKRKRTVMYNKKDIEKIL